MLLLLLLPAPLAAQEGEPIVIGRSYSLPSAALGEQRTVNVWLPPGYAEGEARYPVIYLIDGGMAQDFDHITGLAQLGALSWLTQEFIVVGVETVDRRRELAFPVERDAQLKKDYPTAGEFGAVPALPGGRGEAVRRPRVTAPRARTRCSGNCSPGCSSSRPCCASPRRSTPISRWTRACGGTKAG